MITMADVNQMDFEQFIERFGNVVEHCPLAAGAIWASRPFSDVNDIHECVSTFLDSLPYHGRQAVLRVHPDLAGRVAQQGTLTSESAGEQRSAGLTELTEEERQQLTDQNHRYKAKFGFPFVVCARQNKKAAILSGLEERLRNDEDEELRTGLEEVKKITYLRLLDIVGPAEGRPETAERED
ncbi:2-oxo-4-hydroxy-4-carboxy-5-ureidoimidazoline decarboxylase-like [Amphibalanus amphitrite]|uniref:2-oxo-4-hydroxy-4-carboxy-5-ureidoimidazoline decarboxylase-like n=1 Tax=Amphibalanus amphitrite TaxID=1232801 RepID=UPI001C90660E|nr:2-oxo-4-hydroxy-4-carboxy-5-ureidoimidazoline decarboxylase-like [Amphibalanus amphitrite]